VRLLYDKTAQGEQEIMREFARRLAMRNRLPRKALERQQIVNYLSQQAIAGLSRPDTGE
jgi:hypothetical protein